MPYAFDIYQVFWKEGGFMKKSQFLALFFVFVLICHSALFAQVVEDVTPPAIQSLDFTPKAVDVSAGAQNITVTARIMDVLSGFRFGYLSFRSPSQQQQQFGTFGPYSIQTGDLKDGVHQINISIPQFSEAGEWKIEYIYLFDTDNNMRWYYTEDLAALDFPTVLTVSGGVDLMPPVVAALNITPEIINVSAGAQNITVTARITDVLSGFRFGYLSFRSPSQQQQQFGTFGPYSIQTGDLKDGVHQINISIPQFSEAGEWKIEYIYLFDAVNNMYWYYQEELAALGFSTIINILSNPEDVTPVAIQSLDFTPKTVDVSAGAQNITVTARITDAPSGLRFGYLSFRSHSQQQQQFGTFGPYSIQTGDLRDGVHQINITIPQFSEAGEWKIEYIYLFDAVNNMRWYYTEDLAALDFPTVFTVSENQNPVADAGPDKTALVKEQIHFDGSQSSDSDGYVTAWVWDFGDGSPVVTGTLPSHAYSQPGQYTVTLTITDEEGATALDQAIVVVKTLTTAVEDLMGEVKNGIAGDIQNSLISKLNSALDSLKKKNDTAAVNKLKAFINEVEAQKGKKIPSDVADHWIALANRIIASIQSGANFLPVSALGAPMNARIVDRADSPWKINEETPGFVVHFHAEEAGPIIVAITNAEGILVGILSGRSDKTGEYAILWNGRDQEGNACPKGNYNYQVLGYSKPSGKGVVVIR
jgi:PKD repeat protein